MKAFVIMPFGDYVADSVYRYSTKMVCEEFKLEVKRADEIFTTNPILSDILMAIKEAIIIIADISNKNPNVFYELGLAHLLKQSQTIMITQDDFDNVPFDIAHFRILKYENTIEGKAAFEDQLRKTLSNILRDYRLIYGNEFELIANVLHQTEEEIQIFALIALAESTLPFDVDSELSLDGYNKNFEVGCAGGSTSVKQAFASSIMFGLVEIADDFLMLTEKGRAFVDVLKDKGYVLKEGTEYKRDSKRDIK